MVKLPKGLPFISRPFMAKFRLLWPLLLLGRVFLNGEPVEER